MARQVHYSHLSAVDVEIKHHDRPARHVVGGVVSGLSVGQSSVYDLHQFVQVCGIALDQV